MSYFGKKSLVWWDYHNHDRENAIRFIHTNEELQLKILKKWYPIGSTFTISKKLEPRDNFIIKGYVKYLNFWAIDFENTDIGKKILKLSITPINPVYVIMDSSSLYPINRESKLDRLLNSVKD
jgi:hypothetical protein